MDGANGLDVVGEERPQGPEHEDLAQALQVLGSPARLAILGALRMPTTLRDIRLQPGRSRPGENPDRPASKQTVRAHLRKLMDEALVVELNGSTNSYVVNRRRLFEVGEELNRLTALFRGASPADDDTQTSVAAGRPREHTGPRLTLVHGAYPGSVFPLDGATARSGTWAIGRQEGLPVSLDYDPFVSRRHAMVQRDGSGFALIDAGASRNGTTVNWHTIAEGAPHVLRPGDVIGVGRSLLVFADD